MEKFGLVVLAQAVVMYLANFVDYGFSLSGIREVSLNRNNKDKLSEIFSTIFFTKLVLLVFGLVLYLMLIFSINELRTNYVLFITSYTIVVGHWLLPNWYLQGLEKMKFVALLNIASKIVFLVTILLIITVASKYIYVNFLLGLSQIMLGIIGTALAVIQTKIKLRPVSYQTILVQLRSNWSLFISNFSVFASANSNLVILALIANPIAVGSFAIIEKILIALRTPAVLLYQTVYPRVCAEAEQSLTGLLTFSRQIIRWVYLIFIPLGVLTFLFSHEIVILFSGQSLQEPAFLLRIVSFIPLIVAINIPATQTLIAFKQHKVYAKVSISGAMVNIALNLWLVTIFMATGTAMAALITEVFITFTIYWALSAKLKDYSPFHVLNWV